MPKPAAGESRDDFLDRCMSDAEAVADYPDSDQRFAVCVSMWEGEKRMRHEVKHLDLDLEIKQVSDEGGFEGYASTAGNVDRGGDIVERGAFQASLDKFASRGKMPKMLWQHDKELHILMKNGAIDSMSIGYRTIDADFEGPDANVRRLKEVELWEVSLVTFPMNEEAQITHVKHLEHRSEAARILRKGGVAGSFAELISIHGFDKAKEILDGRRKADGSAIEQGDLGRLLKTLKARKDKFHA